MTTSQFARIPLHNPLTQRTPGSPYNYMERRGRDEKGLWNPPGGRGLPPSLVLPPEGVTHQSSCEEREMVLVNGHSMSPTSSAAMDSDRDQPDTPGIHRTQSFDLNVFDIRRVPPEQIAAQITLIDLEIFKAIRMEEFSNCNWTKKEKQVLSPNIVAFTRRFNHTSFLVVREILNEENEKVRAEIISQFIKIAKKLFELNNIHSLKAVISGLQSTPIYRLQQTWRHVPKKDKSTFEKMAEFLSDDDNRKLLREHLDEAKLPCIPHLGLYLTDLCFLQDLQNRFTQVESILNMIAYCQNSTYENFPEELHVQKYLTHVRYIDELQKFFEDDNYKLSLKYEPSQTPTMRKRHTEHTITPITTTTATSLSASASSGMRGSKSHEDLLTLEELMLREAGGDFDPESPFSSDKRNSFVRRSLNTTSGRQKSSPNIVVPGTLVPGKHKRSVPSLFEPRRDEMFLSSSVEVRKTTTLPTSLRGAEAAAAVASGKLLLPPSADSFSKPRSSSHSPSVNVGGLSPPAHKPIPSPSPLTKTKRGHAKSHSLGSKSSVLASMFGVSKQQIPDIKPRTDPSPEPPSTSLSLLDDSLLDDTFPFTPTGSLGNTSTSGGSSHGSVEDFSSDGMQLYQQFEEAEELVPGGTGNLRNWDLIKEGILKRKTLKLNGNPISQWRSSKCLIQLTSQSIMFMEAKSKHSRKQSKPPKATRVLLKDCRLKHRDRSEKLTDEQFIIMDDDGNSTKFTAKSPAAAMEWVVAIKEAIRVEEERERAEAERSLIKL